jgi:hypothetical protein
MYKCAHRVPRAYRSWGLASLVTKYGGRADDGGLTVRTTCALAIKYVKRSEAKKISKRTFVNFTLQNASDSL